MGWVLDLTTTPPDIYTEDTVQNNVHNALEPPYPIPVWTVTQSGDDITNPTTRQPYVALEQPYPAPVWYITTSGDDIQNPTTRATYAALVQPFPAPVWYIVDTDDDVVNPTTRDCEGLGACNHSTNLAKIKIPMSVKEIGSEGFTNTKLKSVTLADDCTYGPNTFPEDCVVTGGQIIT